MRLRKLTMKSMLDNFGPSALRDSTVERVLEHPSQKFTLVYSYFRKSHINFVDEVLDALNITEKYRIDKPSTNEDLYEAWKLEYNPEYDEMIQRRLKKSVRGQRKRVMKEYRISKSELRDINRKTRF